MDYDRDLARIAEQEGTLVFPDFDAERAWELGCALRGAAQARAVALTIEIRLGGQTCFSHTMPGAAPITADWARRKRNLVELMQQSSYAVGLKHQRDGTTIEGSMGLATRDFAAHGGSFPLRVTGCGCVGVVTVSGLPQREDHALLVAVLAEHLGEAPSALALD